MNVEKLPVAALLCAQLITASVLAQQEKLALEEVVVTAQKREQSLQDIPSAVSAIPAEGVRDFLSAGENIRALAGRVPSLQIESSNGRQSPRFYIRGLGNYDFDVNATQPVSLIYDEVALENSVLKSLPLFDVQRVEVLKGPQGTLFGRSTTAGVVKVDSVVPSQEQEGYIKLGYGSRETFSAEGAFGGALSESVSARGAFKYLDRGAWIDNTFNGPGDDFGSFDEFAYRLQLLANPNDSLSALFKIHGFKQDGDQPQLFYANAFTPILTAAFKAAQKPLGSSEAKPSLVCLPGTVCPTTVSLPKSYVYLVKLEACSIRQGFIISMKKLP